MLIYFTIVGAWEPGSTKKCPCFSYSLKYTANQLKLMEGKLRLGGRGSSPLSIYFAKNNSKVTISSKLTSNNLILTIKDISNILDINLRRKIDIRYKDIDQLSNKLKIKIIYKNNKDHNICQLSIPLNNKDNIVYLHQ